MTQYAVPLQRNSEENKTSLSLTKVLLVPLNRLELGRYLHLGKVALYRMTLQVFAHGNSDK